MLTNGNKVDCGFADEIVSYIYDETGEAERRKFETHLTGCVTCTDEFAVISNARFSVFEWQKEEFAHLSTPDIVIPYAVEQLTVAVKDKPAGFISELRGFLSLVGRPMTAAAVLAVCVGLGFVAMNYIGGGEQAANDGNVPPIVPQIERVAAPLGNPSSESEKHNEIVIAAQVPISSKARDTNPVKVVTENRKNRIVKPLTANTKKLVNDLAVQKQTQQARKAPVLSETDETDDRSLRLTDLFDDGGRR